MFDVAAAGDIHIFMKHFMVMFNYELYDYGDQYIIIFTILLYLTCIIMLNVTWAVMR